VTNDKSRGIVATHLTCGELNTHVLTRLLISLPVKKLTKSVYIWLRYKQVGIASRTLCALSPLTMLVKDEEFIRHVEYRKKKLLLTVVILILP